MEEADALRQWALSTPVESQPPASPDQLARHLEFMAAALPSRANDEETGRKRAAVYASILGGASNKALAFMARRACETLEWFPSPKQCLDILAAYQPPPTSQSVALIACRRFTQATFEEWLEAVRGGGPIDGAPERWLRIATEEGPVRRLCDGSYVSRALYHGPHRPPPPGQPPRFSVPRPPIHQGEVP